MQPSESASDPASEAGATQAGKRRFGLRAFTSLLLAVSFIVLCVSGTVLFLTPRGRIANWTGWTLLGLDKNEWSSLHVNNGILFLVVAVIHLVLNWSVLLRYIRNSKVAGINKKKELAVALVIGVVCVWGPISGVPPFSSVMDLNEDIKDYWEQDTARGNAQPPVPHAEEMTLAELAEYIQLTADQVSAALAEEGYDVDDAELTIGQIAKQKQETPSQVFEVIRAHYPDTRGWGRIGAGNPDHGGAGAGGFGGADAPQRGFGRGPRGETDSLEPGFGRGQGRGMGRGRGMGQGRGAGEGAGQSEGFGP